jgi:hypothetical protein
MVADRHESPHYASLHDMAVASVLVGLAAMTGD